ncbi:MAG TPA: MFS transporter [Chloroflexota bacterium]|nr:MFS transporter [Chloroflexota bacterium]
MSAFGAVAYALRALRGSFAVSEPLLPEVRRDFHFDAAASMIFGIFNGSVLSYVYVVGRTIGVSPLGISVLIAMPAVGSILSLPISLRVQGAQARRFMLGAWWIGRALVLLTLLFRTPLAYTAIMALYLASSSIANPFYAGVMQHIYPRSARGRLMSLVRIGSGLVTTLTSLIVAWLLSSKLLPYQAVFALGSVAALISLRVFMRITPVRPAPRPRESLRATFAILRRDGRFAIYQLAVFIMGFGNVMSATLYPLVVVDKLHAGYGPFGVLTVCSALGYLLSFLLWGRVVDRKGPLFTMGVAGICVVTLPLGLLVAPAVWWLVPILLFAGIAQAGFEIGPYNAVIHYAPAYHEVPRYMALHAYFSGVRGLIGPFLATAILAGHHYTPVLSTALALTIAGTTLIWLGARTEAPMAATTAPAGG